MLMDIFIACKKNIRKYPYRKHRFHFTGDLTSVLEGSFFLVKNKRKFSVISTVFKLHLRLN